ETIANGSDNKVFLNKFASDLKEIKEPIRKDILSTARKALRMIVGENSRQKLADWIRSYTEKVQPKFSSHLFSQSSKNVFSVKEVLPTFTDNAEDVDGRL